MPTVHVDLHSAAPSRLTASLETRLATPALMDMTMDLQHLPMLCLVAICTTVAIVAVHHGPRMLLNYLLDFRYRWHPLYKGALQRSDGTELNLRSESA